MTKKISFNTWFQEKGFSLVELMVVVSIIGILSAVAVPNYQKYQVRARQTEAKVGLSAIFTGEQTAFVDGNSFSACLINIGYLTGAHPRFYTIGFKSTIAAGTTCGKDKSSSCSTFYTNGGDTTLGCDLTIAGSITLSNGFVVPSNSRLGGSALPTEADLTSSTISAGSFTAQAVGYISGTNTSADAWTMDQNSALKNTVNGQ